MVHACMTSFQNVLLNDCIAFGEFYPLIKLLYVYYIVLGILPIHISLVWQAFNPRILSGFTNIYKLVSFNSPSLYADSSTSISFLYNGGLPFLKDSI